MLKLSLFLRAPIIKPFSGILWSKDSCPPGGLKPESWGHRVSSPKTRLPWGCWSLA